MRTHPIRRITLNFIHAHSAHPTPAGSQMTCSPAVARVASGRPGPPADMCDYIHCASLRASPSLYGDPALRRAPQCVNPSTGHSHVTARHGSEAIPEQSQWIVPTLARPPAPLFDAPAPLDPPSGSPRAKSARERTFLLLSAHHQALRTARHRRATRGPPARPQRTHGQAQLRAQAGHHLRRFGRKHSTTS